MGKRARRARREQIRSDRDGPSPVPPPPGRSGSSDPGRPGSASTHAPRSGAEPSATERRALDDAIRRLAAEGRNGGARPHGDRTRSARPRDARSPHAQAPVGVDEWIRRLDRLTSTPLLKSEIPAIERFTTSAFRDLDPAGRQELHRHLEQRLGRLILTLFDHFWLPHDLLQFVHGKIGAEHEPVVVAGMATVRGSLRLDRAPEEWRSSFDDITTGLGSSPRGPHPAWWARIVTVLCIVGRATALAEILPPPGRWTSPGNDPTARVTLDAEEVARVAARRGLDPKVMERVRALLAKAEGTTFEAEAETFMAKAQELMTRHGIEAALLEADDTGAVPVSRRVWIENPYADAKGLLLSAVARANRCRCVQLSGVDCQSLLGFPSDLDAVEVLFTSLLVQGSRFVVAAGAQRDRHGRSSTTSFRKSFWISFGQRIGERLADVAARTVSDVDDEYGGTLLPLLVRREAKVEEAFTVAFPRLQRKSYNVTNEAGWEAGRLAADQADLTAAAARISRHGGT